MEISGVDRTDPPDRSDRFDRGQKGKRQMTTLEITGDADFQPVAMRVCAGNGVAGESDGDKLESVRAILDAVRTRGDEAVAEFTERFDGVRISPDRFEVTPEEIEQASAQVDPLLMQSLERAHANIRAYHSKHLRESWEETAPDGTILGQRVAPIATAGVYVPGGKAFYPSSVLMNIAPARVAGVGEILMVSPPSHHGGIHPVVPAAAKLAGATRIFRVGGAQAIAALAYGTEHIPAVCKITGPGNAYVALAKRLVNGICDIDTEAGPSEVVVIADDAANPAFVAAELLAQAEHDEEARAVLVTPSWDLIARVEEETAKQAAALPRKAIIDRSLAGQGFLVKVRDLDEAIRLSNWIAPEHLSIQTRDPRAVLDRITNAGAVMLGAYTSVAMGDYFAGPNHILPTGRRARYASPLTAEDFRKVTSIISYSYERLMRDAADIRRLAEAEQLTAHANALEVRL